MYFVGVPNKQYWVAWYTSILLSCSTKITSNWWHNHLINHELRVVNWGVLLMLIPCLSVSFQLHQNEIHTGVFIHVTSIKEHVYRELLCQKLAWAVPVKDGRSDNSKGLSRLTALSLPLHICQYFCLY